MHVKGSRMHVRGSRIHVKGSHMHVRRRSDFGSTLHMNATR